MKAFKQEDNKVCPLMSYRHPQYEEIHCCRGECALWSEELKSCKIGGKKK